MLVCPASGDTVEYDFTVTNTGNMTLTASRSATTGAEVAGMLALAAMLLLAGPGAVRFDRRDGSDQS